MNHFKSIKSIIEVKGSGAFNTLASVQITETVNWELVHVTIGFQDIEINAILTPDKPFLTKDGSAIHNPFLDETGSTEVDPVEYYGEFYVAAIKNLYTQTLRDNIL